MSRFVKFKCRSGAEFLEYCRQLKGHLNWDPSKLVVHNTAAPSIAQWDNPQYSEEYRINSMANFFTRERGWNSGPHLIVSPNGNIWILSGLQWPGTHSPSFNKNAFGVEMVGDFNKEDFDSGRGLIVQRTAIEAIAILCYVFEIDTSDIHLHKEDPKTDHDCPGKDVKKDALVKAIKARKIELMDKKDAPKVDECSQGTKAEVSQPKNQPKGGRK